jgi:hypothetical protein
MTIANYSTYVDQLANFLVISSTDLNYQNALSNIVDDAEQRIYRELDLLQTRLTDDTIILTPNFPGFSCSAGTTYVTVETVSVITPAGTNKFTGTLNSLTPASREFITELFPNTNTAGVPQYFANLDGDFIFVGPAPDAAYAVQIFGMVRPLPLSATNVTSLLTAYYPDLFMAGSLVMAAGYMKNFGTMADDPKAAVSWEQHYSTLLQSAQVEEARKRFTSQGWSPYQPAPLASPPRT